MNCTNVPKTSAAYQPGKGGRDLPEGVMSVSLLKHQVTFSLVSVPQLFCLFWRPSSLHVLFYFKENGISLDAFEGE